MFAHTLTTVFGSRQHVEHTLRTEQFNERSVPCAPAVCSAHGRQHRWRDEMNAITTTSDSFAADMFAAGAVAATIDHRTGRSSVGGPVMVYRRVERRASPPNYGLRRLGAAGVLVVALLVAAQMVAAAAAFFGSSPVLAQSTVVAPSSIVQSHDTHVARNGDSMWTIADEHRGATGRESYIDALVDLNGSTSIQVGQAVMLP